MNNVGKIVKEKREAAGLSQNMLAKKAGISQASLNALESKTNNPSVETVFLLAAALDCPVIELLGQSAPQNNERPLNPKEVHLLSLFRQLNLNGQAFLCQQAEMILSQPSFRKEEYMQSIG